MRLVSYLDAGGTSWRAGVPTPARRVDAVDVVDCFDALTAAGGPLPAGTTVRALLEAGLVDAQLAAAVAAASQNGEVLRGVTVGPPIPNPDKILCFGVNYRDHADEADVALPAAPMLFAKFRNSLIGSGSPIVLPSASDQVDYEGELAVVIGRTCRNVTPEEALQYVAGAFPFNDVSARDLQLQVSQWTTGKAVDTFAPCGPELVTLDEVGDLGSLVLTTRVNGQVVQHAITNTMIFPVPELVSFLSRTMTLVPGDVIATGTPSGVGFARTPPLFLHDGDTVEVEIDRLGVLRSPVVDHDRRLVSVAPGD